MLNPPKKGRHHPGQPCQRRTDAEPLRDAAGDAGDHPVRLRSPELRSHMALPPPMGARVTAIRQLGTSAPIGSVGTRANSLSLVWPPSSEAVFVRPVGLRGVMHNSMLGGSWSTRHPTMGLAGVSTLRIAGGLLLAAAPSELRLARRVLAAAGDEADAIPLVLELRSISPAAVLALILCQGWRRGLAGAQIRRFIEV
jgi:hypothetical protein